MAALGVANPHQLYSPFESGGGRDARSRTWHRYVYRKCGYVKVDVEFAPASDKDNTPRDRPDDRIAKISKPYVELTVMI